MMRALASLLVLGVVGVSSVVEGAGRAPAPTPVRRFVLVAGANRGIEDRPTLRYAESDAERFVEVMQALGGVDPSDVILLRQPRLGELDRALETIRARVLTSRQSADGSRVRTEVFFYYSGHADEKGLLLANDRWSYVTLRQQLETMAADVRIGILDACASGAITRPKGGKRRGPFVVDPSSDTRGSAFLASSSADEAAQESERLGASFFTHYLLSGLRGAADVSGDGRVTLNEAYQFAFNETLSRTVGTRGGPQHPVYDITMSGTGDVVLTDLRQLSAGFSLPPAVDGRFYVLDEKRRLVLEFYKPAGRKVDIGLEAGTYEVRFEREKTARRARVAIEDGAHLLLDPSTFGSASVEFTRLRGYDGTQDDLLSGRYILGFQLGMWNNTNEPVAPVPSSAATTVHASLASLTGGVQFLRYVREDLALGVGLHPMLAALDTASTEGGSISNSRLSVSLPFIVRWSPIRRLSSKYPVMPYISTKVGPMFGADVTTVTGDTERTDAGVKTSVGAMLEVGADVRVSRSWVFGISGGYNWSGWFPNRNGSATRYRGAEFTAGFGRILGSAAVRQ